MTDLARSECSVLKVYPIYEYTSYITGEVIVHRKEAIDNLAKTNVDIIVKIQNGLLMPSSVLINGLCVYNESEEYFASIPTSDKNYQVICEKILEEGVRVHPLVKKLYFKAHLNPDFSLDVYLNCAHNTNMTKSSSWWTFNCCN